MSKTYNSKGNTYVQKLLITISIISAICLVILLIYYNHREKIKEKELIILENKISVEGQKACEAKDIKNRKILEEIPGIVCWGDSLTAGTRENGTSYPSILQELISKNIFDIQVVNMGVGGESTNTIIGRAGGVSFVVDSFRIPSDKSEVKISLKSLNGNIVAPLRQGDKGVNPCIIDGVEGIIGIEQESYTSKKFKYYFRRNDKGNAKLIKDGTSVITSGSRLYTDYIPIIFMGQNGGWKDSNVIIAQQRSIINTLGRNKDKFLILGLTTGTRESRSELEQAMLKEYGDRYINLREYLSTKGIVDSGLKQTDTDIKAMNIGAVPPSLLLVDEVHFNEKGYSLIGNVVFERLIKLGYFNIIEKYLHKRQTLDTLTAYF